MIMPETDEPSFNEFVNLNKACNQRCLFCSAEENILAQSMKEVNAVIKRAGGRLTIGGWEPTLHPRLAEIVAKAGKAGAENITLFTNAVLLDDPAYVRRLVSAGVNTFHVNFPSHEEGLSDFLTRSPGSFRRRLAGIRNIFGAPGRKHVSLVFVINSFNYRTMPEYAGFVAANFPSVIHVLFTALCIMGKAEKDHSLVPRYGKIRPYLASAQAVLLRRRIKCLIENVPLCLMPGYEHASFDARQAFASGAPAGAPGKSQHEQCGGCSLKAACSGLRDDYFRVYGSRELKPSSRRPDDIARTIKLLKAARL
ncbi:MAG: radical SAM protein [Elusimicrobiota bacterium]|nr:radical SAM protein [Elusimicrobiota bacterium]